MSSGVYILGSGAPKAYVDSRMKTRSWVENEKLQIEAEEDVEGLQSRKKKKEERRTRLLMLKVTLTMVLKIT